MNKKELFYLTSGFLSYEPSHQYEDRFVSSFPKNPSQWKHWVAFAGSHLVLQSAYLSLQKNDLLQYLPSELSQDLDYLYQLNKKRNLQVIRLCQLVSDQLKKEGIARVFMKGTGNILDGLYLSEGERMVYDVDILVEEDKMLKAVSLLIERGFYPVKPFNPHALSSTMHYPLLVRDDHAVGIEVHRMPVQYLFQEKFGAKEVFRFSRQAANYNSLLVMDDTRKVVHNFMHAQLMHSGHYHGNVSLRDLYDLYLLNRRVNVWEVLAVFGHYKKEADAYVKLMYQTFGTPIPETL